MQWAHNVPGKPPYQITGPVPIARAEVDVLRLMSDLESEFARQSRAREVRAKDGRAILVHVAAKTSGAGALARAEESVRELRELARTAGVEVADTIIQVRERVDPKTVMGQGKLNDVILRAAELDAETLIFDRNLSPAQASAIAKQSDLKVIDRSQLILDIFAQRAESRDGKLQVELAQLKYSLPRLAQKDDALSRLTGGIGGRGPGETKLEIGRRRAKEKVSHLESQLKELAKQRAQRRRKRTRGEVPTVAIVGYTNAGKSTLLNTMTGATVLAENKLFATLDTRSRTLRVGWAGYGDREVVVTDTVGFIRDLPKDLFAAFRATFEEAADADLLLHVVDASDAAKDEHMATTHKVLEDSVARPPPAGARLQQVRSAPEGGARCPAPGPPAGGLPRRHEARDHPPPHRPHRDRARRTLGDRGEGSRQLAPVAGGGAGRDPRAALGERSGDHAGGDARRRGEASARPPQGVPPRILVTVAAP